MQWKETQMTRCNGAESVLAQRVRQHTSGWEISEGRREHPVGNARANFDTTS